MHLIRKITTTSAGLAAAGVLLVTAVPSAQAATGQPSLRQGSSGLGVACVQWEENQFFDDPRTAIAVDGDFGPATYNLTLSYQSAFGLQADGVVGPRTGGVIANAIQTTLNTYPGANYRFWQGYWLSDCYGALPTSG
ncbi:peptidoglycan-binding domain-containing protein [Kitasatospora sp. NPDC004669]|uniref:peptidoglycan-binding domain-containing protein n=1 Tax=Kitasatospora sp. NPDC004669 TaxID=3154555 RepID=UPI0033A47B25